MYCNHVTTKSARYWEKALPIQIVLGAATDRLWPRIWFDDQKKGCSYLPACLATRDHTNRWWQM